MKTFSIRTMLILVAVCGFACWFFFVPVRVTLPVGVGIGVLEQGQQLALARQNTELSLHGVISEIQMVTFVRFNEDETDAIFEMSRWDYLWFDAKATWHVIGPNGFWRFRQ